MPIIKSAIKRVRTAETHRTRNVAVKTAVRKKSKVVLAAIIAGSEAEAKKALVAAIAEIDKAAKRKVLHKNTAARKKSQLTRAYNELAKKPFGTDSPSTKKPAAKPAVKAPSKKPATKAATKPATKNPAAKPKTSK